jgi:hypothetical protein
VLLTCASLYLCRGRYKSKSDKQQSSASAILGENTSQTSSGELS